MVSEMYISVWQSHLCLYGNRHTLIWDKLVLFPVSLYVKNPWSLGWSIHADGLGSSLTLLRACSSLHRVREGAWQKQNCSGLAVLMFPFSSLGLEEVGWFAQRLLQWQSLMAISDLLAKSSILALWCWEDALPLQLVPCFSPGPGGDPTGTLQTAAK